MSKFNSHLEFGAFECAYMYASQLTSNGGMKEFRISLKNQRWKSLSFRSSINLKYLCPPRMKSLEMILECKHLFISRFRIEIILLYCE